MLDKLFCTIDIFRGGEGSRNQVEITAIRKDLEINIQAQSGKSKWSCVAVTRDPRKADRVRIACRDEEELEMVKKAANKTATSRARIMRDQLYLIKVDNVARGAILEQDGSIKTGIEEALGKENEVGIAKISWLSRKDNGKAYGSIVVYLTRSVDARKLLEKEWFDFNGESGFVRLFEPKAGPVQCYKCQQLGHKAFSCTREQVCASCSNVGHHHRDCGRDPQMRAVQRPT